MALTIFAPLVAWALPFLLLPVKTIAQGRTSMPQVSLTFFAQTNATTTGGRAPLVVWLDQATETNDDGLTPEMVRSRFSLLHLAFQEPVDTVTSDLLVSLCDRLEVWLRDERVDRQRIYLLVGPDNGKVANRLMNDQTFLAAAVVFLADSNQQQVGYSVNHRPNRWFANQPENLPGIAEFFLGNYLWGIEANRYFGQRNAEEFDQTLLEYKKGIGLSLGYGRWLLDGRQARSLRDSVFDQPRQGGAFLVSAEIWPGQRWSVSGGVRFGAVLPSGGGPPGGGGGGGPPAGFSFDGDSIDERVDLWNMISPFVETRYHFGEGLWRPYVSLGGTMQSFNLQQLHITGDPSEGFDSIERNQSSQRSSAPAFTVGAGANFRSGRRSIMFMELNQAFSQRSNYSLGGADNLSSLSLNLGFRLLFGAGR